MRYLSSLLLLCSAAVFGQSTFQRVYDCDRGSVMGMEPGAANSSYAVFTINAFDVLGGHQGTGVVKYDANFDAVWNKVYLATGEGSELTVRATSATPDGGLVWAGDMSSGLQDTAVVVKVDANGTVQWARAFPTPTVENAVPGSYALVQAVKTTANGDILVIGEYSYYTDDYYTRLFVARLSANGTVQWTRSLAPQTVADNWNSSGDVQPLDGGGLVVFCHTEDESQGAWSAHLQDNGTLDWAMRYNTNVGSSQLVPVRALKNGNGFDLFVRSNTGSSATMCTRIRTDASGHFVSGANYKVTGGRGNVWDVRRMGDGRYVLTGGVQFIGETYDGNMALAELDANGAVLWSSSFGSPDYEGAISAVPTADGGFLLGGEAEYTDLAGHRGGTPPRPMVIKTDGNNFYHCGLPLTVTASDTTFTSTAYAVDQSAVTGWTSFTMTAVDWLVSVSVCNPTGIAEMEASPFTVMPNPASDAITIRCATDGAWTHELLDASGRTLLSRRDVRGALGLDVSGLAPGRYVLRSRSDARVFTTGVMVVR